MLSNEVRVPTNAVGAGTSEVVEGSNEVGGPTNEVVAVTNEVVERTNEVGGPTNEVRPSKKIGDKWRNGYCRGK